MSWTLVEEDIPNENGYYWTFIVGKKPKLCRFENDSFGLGDDDFNIVAWEPCEPPSLQDLKDRLGSRLCISQASVNTDVDSSRLCQNLAS